MPEQYETGSVARAITDDGLNLLYVWESERTEWKTLP